MTGKEKKISVSELQEQFDAILEDVIQNKETYIIYKDEEYSLPIVVLLPYSTDLVKEEV